MLRKVAEKCFDDIFVCLRWKVQFFILCYVIGHLGIVDSLRV